MQYCRQREVRRDGCTHPLDKSSFCARSVQAWPVAVGHAHRAIHIFVAIEIGSRRILHYNVTDHPTAEWTRQQFREFLDGESGHRYLIHDRDSVFSAEVDAALNGFG